MIRIKNMEYKYPNLYKPITLGRTTFRNRMFSAPMGAPTSPTMAASVPNPPSSTNCGPSGAPPPVPAPTESRWGELTPEMTDEIVAAYAHVAGLVKWAGFELLNTNSINFPPSSPHKVR